ARRATGGRDLVSGILRSPSVILRIVGVRAGSYSLREQDSHRKRSPQPEEAIMRRLLLLSLIVLGVTSCATTDSASIAPPTVDLTGSLAGHWAYTQATLGNGQNQMALPQHGTHL